MKRKLSNSWKRNIGLSNRGKVRSKELRKHLSEILKGRHLSEETKLKMKGRIPWNKGKIGLVKMSIQSRKKMSLKHIGKNHWNWQGGISEENEKFRKSLDYILWKSAVFMRDNYTCKICSRKRGWNKDIKKRIYIEADHIKPFAQYPELRLAIDNGRTLCKECHRQTTTYGVKLIYQLKI